MYIGHLDDWPAGYIRNDKEGVIVRWKAGAPLQQSDLSREARRQHIEAERRAKEAEKAMRDERVARIAQATWNKAMPAVAHEYLKAKDIGPHGLRIHSKGNLLVPMQDQDGRLWNIQMIRPDGTKLFGVVAKGELGKFERLGGRKRGLYAVLGSIEPGKPIGMAEGFATAATVHELTKLPIAVAFDASNLEPVAKALRSRNTDSQIVLFADNDHHLPQQNPPKPNTGLEKAHAAAREVNGLVLAPRFEPHERGTDWNDKAARDGRLAARTQLLQGLAELGVETPSQQHTQRRGRSL